MEIILGKHAGFCFGVKRAVNAVEENKNNKIVTLGPIIHNSEVIKKFEKDGVFVIDGFDDLVDETVVIRSHGIPPKYYKEMQDKNLKYIDCTCPYVKKIQKIAEKTISKGDNVIVVGNKNHPEVIGIKGFSNDNAIIIEKEEDIDSINFNKEEDYVIVVQTTYIREKFNKIVDKLKGLNINLIEYDTICSATTDRQDEAEELSKKMNVMIVIGDTKSSNSNKLYEICKKNCKKTYLIQTVKDLELNNFNSDDRIGIIAGASTPPDIIKEVFFTMSELNNDNDDDKSFEDMLNASLISLHTGDIVEGTVLNVNQNEVCVNLGYKSDGIIYKNEFSDDPNIDLSNKIKPGESIKVYVMRVNDGEGNVLLSKKRVDFKTNLEKLEIHYKEKTQVKGKIVDLVKGGLIAFIENTRVFVPSSQISSRFVKNLSVFKGKEFNFNIIEFDKSKHRIVAGRKDLSIQEEKEKVDKIFSTLEVGSKVTGTVSRIYSFGAFIDLDGIDALLHISEISWSKVKDVKDILKEGEIISATVIFIDKEVGKISLSLKEEIDNPWYNIGEKVKVGEIIEGKVVRFAKFGAFVEILPNVDALMHISEISLKHIKKPDDELSIGDVIKVKVLEVDEVNKRISISKKEADYTSEYIQQSEDEEN